MMTVVAFTTAVATDPGSSPSSRTASVLMRETTRCGPHCSSTCDITVSEMISVTSPTNRLRADRPISEGSAGRTAFLRASWASSRPSTTVRPEPSRLLDEHVVVDPAPQSVVTHAEIDRGILDTNLRHGDHSRSAFADWAAVELRPRFAGRMPHIGSARRTS